MTAEPKSYFDEAQDMPKYKLQSVIQHIGGSSSGHYISKRRVDWSDGKEEDDKSFEEVDNQDEDLPAVKAV